MNSPERAQEVISKSMYMVLATVSEAGEPWNAPVFYAHDEGLNLYWGSYAGAQRSLNVRANGRAFIVIFDSTCPPGKGEGVYIQASVEQLQDEHKIREAHKRLWDRHVVPYWKIEQFFGEAPIRLYKAMPQQVWMNGEGHINGHYVDVRQKITL